MYGDQQRLPAPASAGFVGRFARALRELVSASKPIISSLTMIAGDEPHLAPQIVDMISDEVLRRLPIDRLPVLYLMDSIVKNIDGPFKLLFAPRLPLLVLSTFDELPERHPIQNSILRLVDSWCQSRSFPPEIIIDIKRKLSEPPPPKFAIIHAPARNLPVSMNRAQPPPAKRVRLPASNPGRTLPPVPVVIKAPAPAPEPIRKGPDFSSESLRKSPSVAVNALYSDFPLLCEYCALRIANKASMAKHLDWHFKENREAKLREKSSRSQLWFMSLEDWVKCSGEDEREAPPSFFDQELGVQGGGGGGGGDTGAGTHEPPVFSVKADDSRPSCAKCGEPFEKFWDDNAEDWMFKEAVEISTDAPFVHHSCLDEKR